MSAAVIPPPATVADLYKVEGKAELIGGRIVLMSPSDYVHGRIGFRIACSLDDYATATGRGIAVSDGVGFLCPLLRSGRQSFCPDAAYHATLPADLRAFVPDAPTFAVEVRSTGDYGPAAERAMAAKRADYFEAGTLVVWDVDPDARVVRRHRPGEAAPAEFGPGTEADAEPAAPEWRVAVDWVMG